MAAQFSGAGDADGDETIAAINVTPLVDIVLVLLVVFMVTARLITQSSVPMDLPKAASGNIEQSIWSDLGRPRGRHRLERGERHGPGAPRPGEARAP